jgi:hypothetical protein
VTSSHIVAAIVSHGMPFLTADGWNHIEVRVNLRGDQTHILRRG